MKLGEAAFSLGLISSYKEGRWESSEKVVMNTEHTA